MTPSQRTMLWQQQYKDKYNARMRLWRISRSLKQKQVTSQQRMDWWKNHPDNAKLIQKRYRQKHPQRILARIRVRQCKQQQRLPQWVNLKQIQLFYEQCPQGYHVDHIIPLQGKFVSGLHCLQNLQYMLASENMKKSNTFDITQQ